MPGRWRLKFLAVHRPMMAADIGGRGYLCGGSTATVASLAARGFGQPEAVAATISTAKRTTYGRPSDQIPWQRMYSAHPEPATRIRYAGSASGGPGWLGSGCLTAN